LDETPLKGVEVGIVVIVEGEEFSIEYRGVGAGMEVAEKVGELSGEAAEVAVE